MADFPNVSCAACEESREVDGLIPDCETDVGCIIPRLSDDGQRVMGIRDLLLDLHPLVDPGTVFRICEVDREDLELLALIESELKEQAKRRGDGQGSPADNHG